MIDSIEQNHPIDLPFAMEGVFRDLSGAVRHDPAGSRLLAGAFDRDAYARLLKQTFHYVRHTAPWLARAAARTEDPDLRALLARKAEEEAGHERWVLADLAALGVPIDAPERWPICRALAAYVAWHEFAVEDGWPGSVLGAAYILERLSEEYAGALARRLADLDVPLAALSFMRNHAVADVDHVHELRLALIQTCAPVGSQILLSARITASAYMGLLRSVAT